jgi:hypothetical protein
MQMEGRTPAWLRLAVIGLGLLLAAAIGMERLWLARSTPLWFDEAWTLAVATTPDWRSFLHEAYNDTSGPLYYLLIRAWRLVAGPSDLALRLPGLAAVALAGAAPLMRRIRGLSFEARLTWAAMIFGWWGMGELLAGRCYGPLLAAATFQCIAFARVLEKPTLGRAFEWCAIGAAAVLLQYYAVFLMAAQGVAYLAWRRGAAAKTWPALIAFAPTLGWMAYHYPRLKAFADGAVAWHPKIGPAEAWSLSAYTVNPVSPLVTGAVALVLAVVLLWSRTRRDEPKDPASEVWIVAVSGLAALALVLVSGMLKPSLTARYMVGLAPAVLLAVVLCARSSARAHLAYGLLALLYLGVAARPAGLVDALKIGAPYGYEVASDGLIAARVTDLVFVWDHEIAGVMNPASLVRAGGVFFQRADAPVRVTTIAPRPGEDANRLALAAATGDHPGIIWLYNRNGRTAAREHPPAIASIDPRWTCERVGDETAGTLSCRR